MLNLPVLNLPLNRIAGKLSSDPTVLLHVRQSTAEFYDCRLMPLSLLGRKKAALRDQKRATVKATVGSSLPRPERAPFFRPVMIADSVNEVFRTWSVNEEETRLVASSLLTLAAQPEHGASFIFSGYAGTHWLIQCSRFFFIYQFSWREIRIKAICLCCDYE